jgi:hypothetical protein
VNTGTLIFRDKSDDGENSTRFYGQSDMEGGLATTEGGRAMPGPIQINCPYAVTTG